MFTTQERDRIRDQILARAQADEAIVGAAYTGSFGTDTADRWSDTDLVLAVRGDLAPALSRWTSWLYQEHEARHHWDLPVGAKLIRVFLLPGWIELDLTFAPEDDFAPRGPQWRTIFGQAKPLDPYPAPDRDNMAGDLTEPLTSTLVRELTEPELRRALTATLTVVTDEIARSDPALAARLQPMFADLTAAQQPSS